jgi:LacI family transcriptional regulator
MTISGGKKMSVTIKDIAKVAGVSYSTVSKAINNSPLVKKKTKDRILTIALQLGYEPNMAAKSLVSKKSQIIGIAWPTVERLAWSTLVTKINDLLGQHSYNTLLSINPVESAVSIFNQFKVDGILVFKEENDQEILSEMFHSKVPILWFGKPGFRGFPAIDVNRRKAIFEAVKFLAGLNHKKIAYIGDLSQKNINQQEKFMGFTEGIIQFGLPTHPEMAIDTNGNSLDKGYESAKKLLNSSFLPTAIVSGSYDITAGVLKALKEKGIKVPDDMSVISYDNIPQMSKLEVPINAVGAPVSLIAESIVQSILFLISHQHQTPDFPEIKIELIDRESCCELKER